MDLSSQLQRTLGRGYTLERELGGGGMSRVFVADEPGLGRKVVVKVLAPELAEGISVERFEREIRMVASLQQANIVPLLAAGRTGELPYYTMPFVDGRSLRERIAREGPLPLRDAINILRDIARALAYAHEHGVVHRDIKPDNVLLSGDTAVVSDFGIAKALSVARTGTDREKLTQTGSGIGTPAYMSPEQAVGDPGMDHRTDIYAFGCVAYEVLTGKPPFHGLPTHQIVAAHFQETPRPVAERRADLPISISVLIARCLEKDPARRPQTAREMLQSLDTDVPQRREYSRRFAPAQTLGVAAIVALLATGAVYVSRSGRAARATEPVPPASLAVLPFLNVGGDSAQEYLADGIRDELATAMGKVAGVRIIGRSAAFQYRGRRDLDVRQVGRALGARYLLQGTLRQHGGRLSVSAQLSDSVGGAELWSERFERNPHQLAQVRDEIVRAISDTLRPAGGGSAAGGGARTTGRGTANPQAYDLYLRGEYLLQRRGAGVEQSIVNFERAIAADSGFARAYAGLSAALVLAPFFTGAPPAAMQAQVTTAARRALELDSTVAEAHTSLAIAYWFSNSRDDAAREFQRAIASDPSDAAAHFHYGRLLITEGRANEALIELNHAAKLDQLSPIISAWRAYGLFMAHGLPEALVEIDRAMQIDSTILPVVNFHALLNLAAGRKREALRLMSKSPVFRGMSYAPLTFAATGDTATAMEQLRSMEARRPRPWFTDVERASIMLAIGDTARALDALERSANRTLDNWTLFPHHGSTL